MMTANTGLESLCIHAETAEEFKKRISEVFRLELKQAEIDRRESVLNERYSNARNAELLLNRMFD
jgi:hypothetical protein